MDENVGIGGLPTSTDVAVFYANFGTCKVYAPTNGSPVDWDIAPPVDDMGRCLPYTEPPPYTASGISADISASGSLTQLLGHRDWDDFLYKFQCSTDGRDGLEGGGLMGGVAAASQAQGSEPALQDGELTFQEAFSRHIIYPQRRINLLLNPGTVAAQPGRAVVVLLGAEDLDVTKVELSSLSYGGARPEKTEATDTNGDGKTDLVITFDLTQLNPSLKSQKLFLTGWLKNSQDFVGQ